MQHQYKYEISILLSFYLQMSVFFMTTVMLNIFYWKRNKAVIKVAQLMAGSLVYLVLLWWIKVTELHWWIYIFRLMEPTLNIWFETLNSNFNSEFWLKFLSPITVCYNLTTGPKAPKIILKMWHLTPPALYDKGSMICLNSTQSTKQEKIWKAQKACETWIQCQRSHPPVCTNKLINK